MGGGACVAAFPGSRPESSEAQEGWHEYVEEVALAEELMALLALDCPPNRFANAAAQSWKPEGIPACTATAAVELWGGDEFKRSADQLLADAEGAIEGAGPGGAAGAAPKPIGCSNIWARSVGSGGDALGGGAVGTADGAARVVGGVGVAGSGEWTRPGTAAVLGAEGRHGAEAETQPRIPPRPLSGSFVNPTLYLAFCASGSAFQRWPGACGKGRGRGLGTRSVTGWGREGKYVGLGTGGMRGRERGGRGQGQGQG